MKQSSLIDDLRVVYELMERDPDKARIILERRIYELENDDVVSDGYASLLVETRELRKSVKKMLEMRR